MSETEATTERNQLEIQNGDGHVTMSVTRFTTGHLMVRLTDHGTSSCVSQIVIHQSTSLVSIWWGEKEYVYEVHDIMDVLAEFILTQSMGKVANWVKQNNTMSEATQAFYREKGLVGV